MFKGYPVTEMTEAAVSALPVIDGGGVAVISGMWGIQKTTGFGGLIADRLGIDLYKLFDLSMLIDDHPVPRTREPQIVDEATRLAMNSRGARQVALSINTGAIICSGAIKERREVARTNIVKALDRRGVQAVDVGDFSKAHIGERAAAAALFSLGFDGELIELVEEHDVLRNPRFFAVLVENMYNHDLSTGEDLRRIIDLSARGSYGNDKPVKRAVISNLCGDFLTGTVPFGIAFSKGFHTYDESRELYRIFDYEIDDSAVGKVVDDLAGGIIDPRLKS